MLHSSRYPLLHISIHVCHTVADKYLLPSVDTTYCYLHSSCLLSTVDIQLLTKLCLLPWSQEEAFVRPSLKAVPLPNDCPAPSRPSLPTPPRVLINLPCPVPPLVPPHAVPLCPFLFPCPGPPRPTPSCPVLQQHSPSPSVARCGRKKSEQKKTRQQIKQQKGQDAPHTLPAAL